MRAIDWWVIGARSIDLRAIAARSIDLRQIEQRLTDKLIKAYGFTVREIGGRTECARIL